MKKLFFSFMFLFSIYAFGGIFGGGGGGSSTAVLLKILAVETASKSEHVKNTLEAIPVSYTHLTLPTKRT